MFRMSLTMNDRMIYKGKEWSNYDNYVQVSMTHAEGTALGRPGRIMQVDFKATDQVNIKRAA